jgi:hypothetical protein
MRGLIGQLLRRIYALESFLLLVVNQCFPCVVGEGVAVSVMHLRPDVEVYGVQYCAHTLAEREVFKGSSEAPSRTGPWKFMTQLGSESGLLYRDI